MITHADLVVGMLMEAGVTRLFGMPGGGSNADLVEAAGRARLPFTLAHTETASAFMASAQAEISGRPGACLATLGPGAASIMNGTANAYLDRIPLIVITDCHGGPAAEVMSHQTLPHREMFTPVTKFSAKLSSENASQTLQRAIEVASTPPCGPVHLDLAGEVSCAALKETEIASPPGKKPLSNGSAEKIPPSLRPILQQARKPVLLVGLASRSGPVSSAIRRLCERLGIPALVTYKAKGVVPDRHPWFGGVLTNGAMERRLLGSADLLVAVGLDPVEVLPRPWKYAAPVISITAWAMPQKQVPLLAELVGDMEDWLQAFEATMSPTGWSASDLLGLRREQYRAVRVEGQGARISPHRVVELAAEAYPGARMTCDAGAHMFPVMSLWPAEEPCGVLVSNGLSTMGFALPAAIGAALLDGSKPTLAFIGDGGLLMCLAELRTAARERLRLRIIVFDDGALSLIKIKQIERKYRTDGTTIGEIDWQQLGLSLGVLALPVAVEDDLRACLRETANYPGPVLIAARVGDEAYPEVMRVVRG
jgi:acetolactate synthase-1/2/3 large subunit